MDSGVRGGRHNGRVRKDEEFALRCQILLPVDVREESDGGVKEGLEEFSGDRSFEELPELSQHEELQDLEPHGGKTV